MASSADVVVVGGGAIGLAAAYRCAAGGARTAVVDSSGTRGASWAAAGMLAPISEAIFGEEALTRLNIAAVGAFAELAGELADRFGLDVGLRTEGTLAVAFNADDKAALDRLTAFRRQLGLAAEPMTGREARGIEPYLAAGVRAAVLASDDLSVDNRRYVQALAEAAAAVGVQRIEGDVTAVHRSAGRVSGVELAGGSRLSAGTVLLAAGALTARLTDLPIQPVKGQILRLAVPPRLAAAGPLLRRTVRGLVRGSEVYLVPREHGEIVVGATSEQQGFDVTVTAGGVYELLRNAYELVPISSEFTFVEARAGSRPGTPDNGPVVGELEPGLLVASGHYRNGILLSAITATAVTRLLAGQALAEEWKTFDPHRFAG